MKEVSMMSRIRESELLEKVAGLQSKLSGTAIGDATDIASASLSTEMDEAKVYETA